jgi:hypothetical protein
MCILLLIANPKQIKRLRTFKVLMGHLEYLYRESSPHLQILIMAAGNAFKMSLQELRDLMTFRGIEGVNKVWYDS